MESLNWQVVRMKNNIAVFIKKFGPWGICKIQRFSGELNFAELEVIFTKYHVFRVIIEPDTDFSDAKKIGFKINKEPLLETKTNRVNLRQNDEDLFNSFRKDCRYILRKITNNKSQITINKFDNFYYIWRRSGKRLNIWIPPKNEYDNLLRCFGKNCFCITVGGAAGALVLLAEKTAYFHSAGATKEGTKDNLPYLVVWEAMREAKKRGAEVWDFEGIYDARWPDKKWLGFSHFKKSFGGKEIEYPGSWAKWRWPINCTTFCSHRLYKSRRMNK